MSLCPKLPTHAVIVFVIDLWTKISCLCSQNEGFNMEMSNFLFWITSVPYSWRNGVQK